MHKNILAFIGIFALCLVNGGKRDEHLISNKWFQNKIFLNKNLLRCL